ncbi:MAG: TlpA disulfide reductase family protein [Bacteroidota bacterium]
MRKTLYLFLLASILASCTSKKNDLYTINGTISGTAKGKIFLQKRELDKFVKTDSSEIKDGKFSFTGNVAIPEMRYFTLDQTETILPFFIENAEFTITAYADSLDKSIVKGGPTQELFKSYTAQSDALDSKLNDLYVSFMQAKQAGDSALLARIDSTYNALEKEKTWFTRDFLKKNPKSVVSPYLVISEAYLYELPALDSITASFDTCLNKSGYVVSLKERIAILKTVAVGQPAPDFTMNDTTGKPVKLSSFKGKVLLVDFWASWCRPCRGENPNVVKAYNEFSKKGFDVLGVSFDEDKAKWIKAIKEDKLTWSHVSDLQRWGNAAGKLYGVRSIPANVLLDKNGKIIARNLQGEALQAKLAELLK